MSAESGASEQQEMEYRQAAGGLVIELGIMHGTLFKLIVGLRLTELSGAQRGLIDGAEAEVRKSQERFWGQYAVKMGGAGLEKD